MKRMVFHEITESAIDHAVAQPTRHRLRAGRRGRDPAHPRPAVRLRGVAGAVAAGQPRACRRDACRARRSGSSSSASGSASPSSPPATGTSRLLSATDAGVHRDARRGRRRARSRRARTSTRRPRQARRRASSLDEASARGLADGLERQPTSRVRSVEEKPYRSTPKAPFMTSTLQQEGGRKLRLSARRR